MAICGFILYLSVGAKTAAVTHENAESLELADQKAAYGGLASMCILTSLVYLVDFVFSLINLKNAWFSNKTWKKKKKISDKWICFNLRKSLFNPKDESTVVEIPTPFDKISVALVTPEYIRFSELTHFEKSQFGW